MSKDKDKNQDFEHDSLQDSDSIGAYLESLSQGFSSGRLSFSSGQDDLVVEPKGLLNLAVKARKKSDRVKISIKVSWKTKNGNGEMLNIQPKDKEDS
jgi:amphi-Trp domain-containing protein